MLGKIVLTKASVETSRDILKDLSERVSDLRFDKRTSPISDFKSAITLNRAYHYMGEEYKITFGKTHHANGIGNNNEMPIYLENLIRKEKCLIGFLFVLIPIYGNKAEAMFRDVSGKNIA